MRQFTCIGVIIIFILRKLVL